MLALKRSVGTTLSIGPRDVLEVSEILASSTGDGHVILSVTQSPLNRKRRLPSLRKGEELPLELADGTLGTIAITEIYGFAACRIGLGFPKSVAILRDDARRLAPKDPP